MAGDINASVTLHVEIFDPQAMWEHARHIYAAGNGGRDAATVNQEFIGLCREYPDPDVGECLRMIFDPGESPPGIQIADSSVKVLPPAWDERYLHFIGDRGELGTDGFGGGHD